MAWSRLKWASVALTGFLLALASSLTAGCATEREPINRVQPNALEKSFFVGEDLRDSSDDPEFYGAATIIDVPYGARHGLFSGLTGGLTRIKWEISEDVLLARRTYEHIEDVDGRGARTTNDGIVVAAFAIDKHFDIKRHHLQSLIMNIEGITYTAQAASREYHIDKQAPQWPGFEDIWIPVRDGLELSGRIGYAYDWSLNE